MTTKHAPCQPTAEDTDLPLLVSRSMGTDSSILWATCWINHGPVQGLRNCRELPWTISSLFPFLPEQVWEVGPDVLAWALLEAPFREHGLCVCSSWSEVAQSLSKEGQLMYKSIRTGVPWIGGTSLCTRGDVGELGVHSALKALVIKITQLSHPAAGLSSTIVVQSLSHVQLFPTPWTAVCQASLSFTISQSLLKLMSIESVMPSHPLSPASPSALNLSQHQGLFQWVGFLHQVAKVSDLQHQSFQWIFKVDFL